MYQVLTVLLVALLIPVQRIQAQFIINESFEDFLGTTTEIPLGWHQEVYGNYSSLGNFWEKRNNLFINPSCTPHSGSGLLRYESNGIPAGIASLLASKKLDMRSIPGGGAVVNFWMLRDSSSADLPFADRVSVWVNSTPDLAGTPQQLMEQSSGAPQIHRSSGLVPLPVNPHGWNQYSYLVPPAWNTGSVYVIFLATSENGNNIFIDDVSISTYPSLSVQSYIPGSGGVTNQNTTPVGAGYMGDAMIIGAKFTLDGNYSSLSLTNMIFNTNGSTNPQGDILSAKLWYTRGTPVFNPGNAILIGTYSQPWLTNYTFLQTSANYIGMSSLSNMDHGDNYFWITFSLSTSTASSGNFIDSEWLGFTLSSTNFTPSVFSLTGNREIVPGSFASGSYPSPSYTIGGCLHNGTLNDYINNVTLQGNLPVGINNSYNTIYSYAGPGCNGPFPQQCARQVHPNDYEFFQPAPGKTTSLTADGTTVYSISIQAGGSHGQNYVAAWIDFNADGTFGPSEKIGQSGPLNGGSIYTNTFTVPLGSAIGQTILRVREVWHGSNMDPIASAGWGETEDYVIAAVPDCPSASGWTKWLGITDEWSDPINWCPSVVPVAPNPFSNVLIPGGPSGVYTYYRPVIRYGVNARANKLKVAANDTIFINATEVSSLVVLDSLYLEGAGSSLRINSNLTDSAQVHNGMLAGTMVGSNYSPFKGGTAKSRSFLMFTKDELLSRGLRMNDKIIELKIHLERYATSNMVFQNFNVKMYYTSPAFIAQMPSVNGSVPPVIGSVVTVYSNASLDLSSWPLQPSSQTLTLPLSVPFAWDGSNNKLVVEICYDNNTNVGAGGFQPRYTQTSGVRNYLSLMQGFGSAIYPLPVCGLQEQSTVNATGTIGSNILTVSSTAGLTVGQLVSGGGIGPNTYIALIINSTAVQLSSNLTGSFTNVPRTFGSNVIPFASEYRPNITFVYDRPYQKYPIHVGGHWVNNGTFIPGISRVTLDGSNLQRIAGSSITTFHDLRIANSTNVAMNQDLVVTDSLHLQTGRLKLNNHQVTLTNPGVGALTFDTGDLQSDMDVLVANTVPWGRLNWNMGSAPGTRTIPFISSTGVRIPLDYNIDSGDHQVVFATYNTAANNTNIPLPSVTNIYGFNNAAGGAGWGSDGYTMADRFYMIENTGVSPQADITLRYASPLENAEVGNTAMSAQRWLNAASKWEYPFVAGQTFTPGGTVSSVHVPNYDGFAAGNWWAIVGTNTPLPVELLNFSTEPKADKVKLLWSTASEYNNNYFEVERTSEMSDFTFIGRVESQGNNISRQDYHVWDHNPLPGIQYYYLRQYDHDGTLTSYGPVSAKFSNNVFEIVTTTIAPTEMGVTVVFNYDSNEPVSYRILDMTGRLIIAKDKQPATPGANVIDIDVTLAKGSYQIMLQNSNKVVSRKFFY